MSDVRAFDCAFDKGRVSPFGEVVETGDVKPKLINEGFAGRFDDLAGIDVAAEGGEVNVSLFIGSARPAPLVIKLMERHPLGSQLFMPLSGAPWLVVVCTDPEVLSSYRAFAASGRQGVNYARNCWHHPLLVVGDASPFLVIDRKGPAAISRKSGLKRQTGCASRPMGGSEPGQHGEAGLERDEIGLGRDGGPFCCRAPDATQQECREPRLILLCMGLFSRFCVRALWGTAHSASKARVNALAEALCCVRNNHLQEVIRMSFRTYHVPPGGHPAQTELLTGRAVFTDAYAVIPKGVIRDS